MCEVGSVHVSPIIRLFDREDIQFALRQTSREGWDANAELFGLLLEHDPQGCFIAECDGQPVGMVTTTRYRRTAWIGNLIVTPEHRRHGIGSHLMSHAMKHIARQGIRTIRLEADPPGIRLYRRFGFVDEFESLRFAHAGVIDNSDQAADRFAEMDLPEVAAFDAEFFGDDRVSMLRLLLRRAKAACRLSTGGSVRAYAIALPSASGVQIGPWIGENLEAANRVLRSVLSEIPGVAVGLGVPCVNREAVELLTSLGFQQRPSSLRMVCGEAQGRGLPEHVFAIGSGAMG